MNRKPYREAWDYSSRVLGGPGSPGAVKAQEQTERQREELFAKWNTQQRCPYDDWKPSKDVC